MDLAAAVDQDDVSLGKRPFSRGAVWEGGRGAKLHQTPSVEAEPGVFLLQDPLEIAFGHPAAQPLVGGGNGEIRAPSGLCDEGLLLGGLDPAQGIEKGVGVL